MSRLEWSIPAPAQSVRDVSMANVIRRSFADSSIPTGSGIITGGGCIEILEGIAVSAEVRRLEEFTAELKAYEVYTFKRFRFWSQFYHIERSFLIIFSVLTTTDALNAIPLLSAFRPSFGVIVALLTAFDVWLKPETKYKGYYSANDEFEELVKKLKLMTNASDPVELKKVYTEYTEINKRLKSVI
jgi:hypothetical protein